VRRALRKEADPEKAAFLPNFFKTPEGYPAHDKFLGVMVPAQRKIAKLSYKTISLKHTTALLQSPWHEERLTALFILVLKFAKANQSLRNEIFTLYLDNTQYIDNWDLVDSSAEFIVGPWLENSDYKMQVLEKLAGSKDVWERRIAMLSTFHYIKQGRADEAFVIIEILLHDSQPYIHKAVGWMLREIGKRVDRALLLQFLDKHAHDMPRTALRYAIEHLPLEKRQHYLRLKNA
jgi:3-methyladenine DNA glycosylase AlkD